MTEQERQDHIAMLRKRALVPLRTNVLETVAGGVEWCAVRPKTSVFVVAVVTIIFGGLTLLGTGSALATTVVVLGIAGLAAIVGKLGPDQETVLTFDEARQVLEAPMAGLEIHVTTVTKIAVRRIVWKRTIRSGDARDVRAAIGWRDRGRTWLCVYAFTANRPHLLFAECSDLAMTSGIQSVVARLAAHLNLPLMEPERHHGPTVLE